MKVRDFLIEVAEMVTIPNEYYTVESDGVLLFISTTNEWVGNRPKVEYIELDNYNIYDLTLESLQSQWEFSLGDKNLFDHDEISNAPLRFSTFGISREEAEKEAPRHFISLKRLLKEKIENMENSFLEIQSRNLTILEDRIDEFVEEKGKIEKDLEKVTELVKIKESQRKLLF